MNEIKNCPMGPMLLFFKYFCRKKFSKKMAFLTQNKAKLCQKLDHDIVFLETRLFAQNLRNCNYNVDPRSHALGVKLKTCV
jgi:hypothetical protein